MNAQPKILIERIPASLVVTESNASGPVRVRCDRMSVAGEINDNRRIYPLPLWKRCIQELKLPVIGGVDHPEDGRDRLLNSAIRWDRIWLDGRVTLGEGTLLNTSAGKDLAALLRDSVTVGISSRGMGTTKSELTEDGRRADVVQDDFVLTSFDAVLSPSFAGARLQMESLQQQKGEFTDSQLAMRRLAGLKDSFKSNVDTKPTIALTEEQWIMRQRSGLSVTEWAYPASGDGSGDGNISDRNLETADDEKAKTKQKANDNAGDMKARLRDALTAKKRNIEPLEPESETSWIGYDSAAKRLVRIRFERKDGDSVKVVAIELTESKLTESIWTDAEKQRVRQLAGIA